MKAPPPLLVAGGALALLGLVVLTTNATRKPATPSGEPPPGILPPHPPVPGRLPLPVSSRYGWRTHPVTGARDFHGGLDLPMPVGTPVFAPLACVVAKVERAEEGGANGNAVFLAVGGYRWCVLHLDVVAVRAGTVLPRGALVGLSGNTGRSTGPHLHVQVYDREGGTVNPENFYAEGTFSGRSA